MNYTLNTKVQLKKKKYDGEKYKQGADTEGSQLIVMD